MEILKEVNRIKCSSNDYEQLRVTTNDYKRLRVKLGMTITAIGNKHRHKNVYYDYTTTNVVNALKSVLKIVVLHFW